MIIVPGIPAVLTAATFIPEPPAVGGTVLDDFNDGNITEYSGDTGNFSAEVGSAYEGAYGLLSSILVNGGTKVISRATPATSQTKTYSGWLRLGSTNTINGFLFGFQDTSNYYRAEIQTGTALALVKYAVGSSTPIASVAISASAAVWYQVAVAWAAGGGMTISWSGGAETANGTENTWSTGGLGWRSTDSPIGTETCDYDYFVEA